jgi:hypothetical protein
MFALGSRVARFAFPHLPPPGVRCQARPLPEVDVASPPWFADGALTEREGSLHSLAPSIRVHTSFESLSHCG